MQHPARLSSPITSLNDAPLPWPSVRESSDPLARPFTATGRLGKVNIRHFRQTMSHAIDVDGLVWSFFPSQDEAETHAARKVAEGHDAIVVPAKPYVPSESPLPRPVVPILRPVASRVADGDASWSGGALYATRLNHLFATVLSADGDVYSSGEVAEALQSDGFMIHADSIDRLRAGNGARPSDQLSFALAFFFDVDPDYFFYESDQGPTGDCFVPNEQSSVNAAGASDFRLTQPQLVRVLAGLTQAASKSMEAQTLGARLSDNVALVISDAAALILESMSGEVAVSSALAVRIIDAWRGTNPCSNGTEPDYLWASGIFGD